MKSDINQKAMPQVTAPAGDAPMTLFGYWRSTTSYRARIALNLKGLAFQNEGVNLLENAQFDPEYLRLNPLGAVPTLRLADGRVITQSMAIIEYLETLYPEPPLLPADPVQAAQVRAAALVIACDIHPVNNLRVGAKLKATGQDQAGVIEWMIHWMNVGLAGFEALIAQKSPFCFGETPGLADICLIPQLYNAHRWGVDLTAFPRLSEIEHRCLAHPDFIKAHPDFQSDRPQSKRQI